MDSAAAEGLMSTRLPLSFSLIADTDREEPPYFDVNVSLVMRAGAETVTIWRDNIVIFNFDDGSNFDPEGPAIERAIDILRELLPDVMNGGLGPSVSV